MWHDFGLSICPLRTVASKTVAAQRRSWTTLCMMTRSHSIDSTELMTRWPRLFTASLFSCPLSVPAPPALRREYAWAAGLLLWTIVAFMAVRPAEAAMASDADVAFAPSTPTTALASWTGAAAHDTARSRVWPWWRWYRTGVSPQFAYRQVVETGPRRGRRAQRFEVRTRYRYVPRRVSRRVADVDVLITGVDVYRRGRFLGSIERIPLRIRRTRARIFRNRPARIDREIAVIGGDGLGYELLALRPERVWQRPAVLAAAQVNIRRGAAIPVRRSSLVYGGRARYLTPIPLLPPNLGRISTQLLRYDISYYDDSHFGPAYDGPRWQHDDGFRNRLESRFEDEYDWRFDRDNEPINEPRTVPRPSRGEGRESPTPFRQEGSLSTQFAANGRSEQERSTQQRSGRLSQDRRSQDRRPQDRRPQNRGARKSIEKEEPRSSLPGDNARRARNASPMIASRSDNESRGAPRSQMKRSSRQNARSAGRTASRSAESAAGMRMARRADSSTRRSAETAGRSASSMRRTPEAVTKRDTRTVGEGEEAVTVKRETKIVRLDDHDPESR